MINSDIFTCVHIFERKNIKKEIRNLQSLLTKTEKTKITHKTLKLQEKKLIARFFRAELETEINTDSMRAKGMRIPLKLVK